MDSVPQSKSPTTINSHIKMKRQEYLETLKGFSIQFSQKGERVNIIKYSTYLSIHSPQGFSGIVYNTGWGTLPDCFRCSLQVMKEWVMMPPYMSVKENKHWTETGDKRNSVSLILLHSPGLAHYKNTTDGSRVSGSKAPVLSPGVQKRGLDPAFQLLFHDNHASRTSVISIPNSVFCSQYRIQCQDFGESHFPRSGLIPYPVKKFGVFPNPALYFGQIPHLENTIPDLVSHFSSPTGGSDVWPDETFLRRKQRSFILDVP